MGYPISNLRNDFEDINLSNYEIVKQYFMLENNALTTGDFRPVSTYYQENAEILDKVIRNADVFNSYTKAIEDLVNYTIATKNQLFFLSESQRAGNDFDTLDKYLVKGDIICITEDSSRRVIKRFEEKLSDGSYQLVGQVPSNKKYAKCERIISSTAYVTIENSEVFWEVGNDIFIWFPKNNISSELYLDINGISYDNILCKNKRVTGKYINNGGVYHFVLCDNEDEDGNYETYLELLNSDIDTGWIDCILSTGVNSYGQDSFPQVRRIGNTVHLRGAISSERPFRSLSFSLPSEIFYPSKEEYFVQHTHHLENGATVFDTSTPSLVSLQIKKNGDVNLCSISDSTLISNDIALNCNATWLVD